MKKRLLSIVLTLCMVLTLLPTVALAAETTNTYGSFSVTYDDSGTAPTYSSNVLTLGSGTYTVAMADGVTQTATDKIVVSSGMTANITLNGMNIDVSGTKDACAFDMAGATVNLTISGATILKSGSGKAGLRAPSGATLTIGGTGSLSATGGGMGAGIGGNGSKSGSPENGGGVTINSGTVTATGGASSGFDGAGIGGGSSDSYGSGQGCTVNITGGIVTANGINNSAGIGGGGYQSMANVSGGIVNISGGTVIANGGSWRGAGIGGGGGPAGGAGAAVTITGGTVKATRGGAGLVIGAGAAVASAGTENGTLKNGSNVDLKLYTLTLSGISAPTAVTGLTLPNSYSYGINDMNTDSNGKLYLYLPADITGAVTVTTAAGPYLGCITNYAANLLPTAAMYAAFSPTAAAGGDYLLDTTNKILTINTAKGAAFWSASGTAYLAYTVKLANNIDVSPFLWTPVGDGSGDFTGTFDGQGHTLKGMTVYMDGVSQASAGLFGSVSGATIKNVGLINSSVTMTNTNGSSYNQAGGIVGYASEAAVINCYNAGSVAISGSGSYGRAGGIAGYANGGAITNCYSTASAAVSSSNPTNIYAGGVLGYASDSPSVTNCYFLASAADKGIGYGTATATGCGTFSDNSSNLTAGTETGFGSAQTLPYTGTLLDALNCWVSATASANYYTWKADSGSTNGGYPVFDAALVSPSYAITASAATNGSYAVKVGSSEVTSAKPGDTVTITPTGNTGYEVDAITVYKTGDADTKVAVSSNSFTMPNYPVTVSATFKALSYDAAITAQKNGDAWTGVASDNVVLSTSETSATEGQKTAAPASGVFTFSDLDGAKTYYVWAKNNAGTYVEQGSVSAASTTATINYYEVALKKVTGIETVTGDGTYLSGETASVSATLTDGYTWEKWSDGNTTQTDRSITVNAKTDLTASATLTAATAPTVSVTGADLTYGYASGSVSVTATAADGHTITGYQWYSNSTNSNSSGTLISGATSASYALGTGKAVGATEYYYCVITSTRTDNSQTVSTTSDVATVTVSKAEGSGNVSIEDWTYGGTAKTPTPTSTTNGTGSVTYSYEGVSPTTYAANEAAPTAAGNYKVTATFAATDSYKECTATENFTIAPQPVTKPTADLTSFVYTGSEQTYTLTENTLYYTITGNKRTNAGEQTVTVALKDKANYVWATSNDTTDLTFTFTIAKAPVSFAVSGNTLDYNAAAHTATVTQTTSESPSVAGHFNVAYQKDTETETASETNVGVYKIIVKLTDDNFKFAGQADTVRSLTLTDKLTIKAVAYPDVDSITLPTAGSLTYGAKLSDSALTGGDTGCTYAWKTGTTIPTVTNTGYAVVCTPKDTSYDPFEKTVSITVSKATPTLMLPMADAITYGQKMSDSTFTGGSAGATYNGTANTNVPGAYSWSANTTAPQVSDSNSTQYEVTFTPTDTANYSTATGKITLTVNPKPVTLTWDYTTPFTYDGAAKTVTATVSNKIGEDTFTLAYSDNSKTNAGSYTAKVTALGNSNYTLTGGEYISKEWGIQKAPISFGVKDTSYTYDTTAHKATVAQTASETPVIATDKYAVTYKLPADGSGTTDKTAVGVYDVIVTLSDDNFCFAGETDESTRIHTLTDKLTITKNTVTALWKNTTAVYDGTAQSPEFELVGLKAADTGVTARLTESKTNADTYAVTAELTGTNSGNYTLTNPNGTFIIQRAPVSFTLTGNSVKKGESVNVIASPSVNGIIAALTYWQSGKQVAAPTETGSYDVYAEITNPNYRHAGGTDGSAQKIGVLTIYDNSIPTAYTVTFDANGGTGSTASMAAVQTGTVRVLPESGFTSAGKVFAGWQYNGKTYQPGECFTQPSSNVTLKALWNDKVYSIGGIVQEGDPAAAADHVVVTLMLGSRQIGQTVTGADGKYSFAEVVPGVYNLVANKDGVTQTVMVTIKDKAVADQTITMPTGKLNSVVEVKAGSPAIVVGDLEKAFTQQDKTDAASKTVELKLTAEAKAADSANTAQQAIEKKAGSVDLFLDFTLTKTIDGTPPSSLDSSPVLLTAVITLPAELQGRDSYTVYRYHGTEVQTLTTTANKDGEKIEVSKDKTTLTVYTKNFSAYAIKGVTYSSGGGSDVGGGGGSGSGGGVSSYKLTFQVNGGSAIATISTTSGTTVDLSAYTSTREGYTFAGWYSDAKLTKAITSVKLTTNTTIYVKWTKNGDMRFTDVPSDAYYYDAVLWTLDKGITGGTMAATFNPNGICTRAQTVTFLWRAMGSPEPTATNCPFTDVTKDAYYYKAVLWATEKGITAGTSGTTFSPDATVTRGQTVTFLWRTADKPTVTTANLFGDVNDEAYYANAVLWAVSKGITSGTSTATFSPADGCTRAQIVTFLYRYLSK